MNNITQLGFEHLNPKFKIDKPVRLIELFAGIGSQAKALQNLGVDFEKWVISEWEVNATKSYKAIHCENDNTDYSKGLTQKELINALFSMGISNDGKEPIALNQIARKNEKWLRETYNAYKATHNISNLMLASGKKLNIVDVENYIYILTYSFPCQDLSLAGKQAGMKKGSKTRSGLLWEVERLLNECTELPQVLLMENVTQVHNKKNFADFKKWVECLEDLGYSNYYADLNAKDYGVPQNRNRCFMVSLLGDYSYTFPLPIPLRKRLKDILETNVDEKYYVSIEFSKFVTNPFRIQKKYTTVNADIAIPLKARDYASWNGNYITNDEVIGSTQKHAYRGSLDEQNGYIRTDECVGTIMTDGSSPKHNNRIIEPVCINSKDETGKQPSLSDRIYKSEAISTAITTSQFFMPNYMLDTFRVRKLTPKECLRLMTFDDADYEKIKAAGISDSAIYKQAGNSIVVKVMMFIFAMLFDINIKEEKCEA